MHIHIPKPVHDWREFIGEVGIIVIGVLIALGAESLIERWHWHEQTAHTREVMKQELFESATNAWERVAVGQCLQTRLTTLFDGLKTSNGAWVKSPTVFNNSSSLRNVVPPAYALPSRNYASDAWKNALASGIVNHMSAKEVASYSVLYSMISTLENIQGQEALAAAKLAPLALDLRLDDRAKIDMIAALAEVDRTTSLITLVSEQYIKALHQMHLGFDTKSVREGREYILTGQRRLRGNCVQPLPLDLG